MDRITIRGLEVFANHGVFPEEKKLGQKFLVDCILYLDLRPAGKCDDLTKSVNYGEVCGFITEFMQKNTFDLIETCAEGLAAEILNRFPPVRAIDLEVKKPWAPVGLPVEDVSVAVHRGHHKAYIALGSNMGDKQKYLDNAVRSLSARPACSVLKVSDFITTAPYGYEDQDDFLNGVLCLDTLLTPEELLELLHEIEQEADRKRQIHWGPRTLDLDIIFYDDLILDTETLHIPHIDMYRRDFVLKPMVQIAPWFRHPLLNLTMQELLERFEKDALTK